MRLRTAAEKADQQASWLRPDQEFFSAGACHILAGVFLESHPASEFSSYLLQPARGFRGGHVVVVGDDDDGLFFHDEKLQSSWEQTRVVRDASRDVSRLVASSTAVVPPLEVSACTADDGEFVAQIQEGFAHAGFVVASCDDAVVDAASTAAQRQYVPASQFEWAVAENSYLRRPPQLIHVRWRIITKLKFVIPVPTLLPTCG